MDYQNIVLEKIHQIAHITINRPDKLNALNKSVLSELAQAIVDVNADTNVRVAIITGSGVKAFVAGADIAEFQHYNAQQGEELAKTGQANVFDAIENSDKPFIAAINGFALGGGLELAMACHIRVAADTAKMGLPEVSLGLIPGYGGTQRLTQLVGKGLAIEIITTAEMITAERAAQIGLVNHVVAADALTTKALEIAEKIKLRAPLAITQAIKATNQADTDTGFATEIKAFGNCFGTTDFKEGVSAFLEKRKPVFSGK